MKQEINFLIKILFRFSKCAEIYNLNRNYKNFLFKLDNINFLAFEVLEEFQVYYGRSYVLRQQFARLIFYLYKNQIVAKIKEILDFYNAYDKLINYYQKKVGKQLNSLDELVVDSFYGIMTWLYHSKNIIIRVIDFTNLSKTDAEYWYEIHRAIFTQLPLLKINVNDLSCDFKINKS